ncbi:radical SAM/SPASM domain-containing protein [Lentzea albida]|uniref:Radical SAM superfamily enzyme, MoaA/NifB/PqqE/SkfB family n=1 Tax=Lentzea albida TaxID=65499 RepID=A0A1H9X0E6_9PSEU|nr:radical SAM/SPASM domain-containing protein [Lentzea albida]SES39626.1 Radical SAM superfamily enzyme, MoaA/NifB/PqqE/SkfB family [Lentzea albida]
MGAQLDPQSRVTFAWLEVTGKCQLQCDHCYADSGPAGSHGAMTTKEWTNVIDQLADLGTRMVQFIGGEPTLHRGLPGLVGHALGRGLEVEVFTNLVHVSPILWEVFSQPGVRLATSYYSDDAEQHERITRGRRSYERTRSNLVEAVRRSVPVRVGVIDVDEGQRVQEAVSQLRSLGVEGEVRVDRLRQVGRGVRDGGPELDELCGQCGDGRVAIAPDGSVWPCVFSRWLPVGNVREESLVDILTGPRMTQTASALAREFARRPLNPCVPNMCDPQCGPSCSPACRPAGNCTPSGACAPDYH